MPSLMKSIRLTIPVLFFMSKLSACISGAAPQTTSLDADGTLFIQLSGTIQRTQDDCELDRLRAQIWSTFRQYKGFKKYTIMVNSAKLGDLVHSDR
jgi:hypothetical protein